MRWCDHMQYSDSSIRVIGSSAEGKDEVVPGARSPVSRCQIPPRPVRLRANFRSLRMTLGLPTLLVLRLLIINSKRTPNRSLPKRLSTRPGISA